MESDFPRRRPLSGLAAALAIASSAAIAYRLTSSRRAMPREAEPQAERSLTLDARSPDELRTVWRDAATLRRVLARFAEVEPVGPGETRWRAGGESWIMRLEEDATGGLRWRPNGKAPVRDFSLRFREATGNRGTVVTLRIEVHPPGGALGRLAGRAFGDAVPSEMGISILHAFKALVETGEIATTDHQPAARRDTR